MNTILKIFSQIDVPPGDLKIPQTGTPDGSTVADISNIVFIVFGGVAVIIIIYAGIQFMLSQGDPGKATTARNTIIYAAVGLGITILAFTIVSFVTGKV